MAADIVCTYRLDTSEAKRLLTKLDQERREARQREAAALAAAPRGILAIDFDDTLTAPGGVEALVTLRERGYGLVVHTANADHDGIRAWLGARWPADAGPPPPVTDVKPQAIAFIDDKAVRFTDWPAILEALR